MPKTVPETPSAPKSLAPYSPAAEAAGLVFLSGQVGIDPETGDRAADDVATQAHQVMSNIGSLLGDLGLGFDDVVKTTIFLADIDDFATVNGIYGRHLPDPPPARSTFAVGALPKGGLVEIEAIAYRRVADGAGR